MSTLEPTHSLEEVAAALGQTPRYVADKCRARLWPYRKGAYRQMRFTAADYAQILELIAQAPAVEPEQPRMSFAPRSRRRAS